MTKQWSIKKRNGTNRSLGLFRGCTAFNSTSFKSSKPEESVGVSGRGGGRAETATIGLPENLVAARVAATSFFAFLMCLSRFSGSN